MKKLLAILFLVLLFVSGLIFYKSYLFLFFVRDRQLIHLTLKNNFFAPSQKELLVEVVREPASVVLGLSNRLEMLSQNGQKIDGMLFVMPSEMKQSFWMKDMHFAIDICWLNRLILSSCERNAKPVAVEQKLPVYVSPLPVDLVLETLPGFFTDQDFRLKFFFQS